MAYSEAQKEATFYYINGTGEEDISDFAKSQGKSLNNFINEAIDFQMNQGK